MQGDENVLTLHQPWVECSKHYKGLMSYCLKPGNDLRPRVISYSSLSPPQNYDLLSPHVIETSLYTYAKAKGAKKHVAELNATRSPEFPNLGRCSTLSLLLGGVSLAAEKRHGKGLTILPHHLYFPLGLWMCVFQVMGKM